MRKKQFAFGLLLAAAVSMPLNAVPVIQQTVLEMNETMKKKTKTGGNKFSENCLLP